ncbi:hypothetical protein WG915_00510 [Corynebacterium sp. H128]|uniref:hypothetical protein n=1 Tax=unclassified Corynebacterium TaxID=2624378 RepID=UPI0030B04A93
MTMISARTANYSPQRSLGGGVVPPAATWNGEYSRPGVQVRTRYTVQHRATCASHADHPRTSPRDMRRAKRQESLAQIALGGILGLAAVIGMVMAEPAVEQPYTETTVATQLATVQAK